MEHLPKAEGETALASATGLPSASQQWSCRCIAGCITDRCLSAILLKSLDNLPLAGERVGFEPATDRTVQRFIECARRVLVPRPPPPSEEL